MMDIFGWLFTSFVLGVDMEPAQRILHSLSLDLANTHAIDFALEVHRQRIYTLTPDDLPELFAGGRQVDLLERYEREILAPYQLQINQNLVDLTPF
ncbi:MAG: hypothetical protein CMM93_09125 [Rickettsiales bacterium]|nr:hypothetical protein [Rickettsiales bacterium]MAR57332.1 hypothetical protein [Rickettsiales bacterium]|tara:strand:- start:4179 stop:4466 length:288 start_codon:yes stop_codon:yes gene_type:complete